MERRLAQIFRVMERRSCRSSFVVWRDTYNAFARVVVVSLKSDMKSCFL